MKVAVIDVGSNSTRLLVAEVEGRKVHPLRTGLETTRLGRGISEKRLHRQAMENTAAVIKEFKERAREAGGEIITAAGTSAVRDAENDTEFLHLVEQETGLQLRVLSGEEEAYYTYEGVRSGLHKDAAENTVLIDLGGGSTEFIWQRGRNITWKSVNAGAVRMTEGGHSDAAIEEILAPALQEILQSGPGSLVGVGGTVTNLAAVDQGLKVYDPSMVHGYRLTLDSVERLLKMFRNTPVEERAAIPGLQPERADIIEAGTRMVKIIMHSLLAGSMEVSEADILYGLALEVSQNVERNLPCTYLI